MKQRLFFLFGVLLYFVSSEAQEVDVTLMLQEVNAVRSHKCKCGRERKKAAPALVWDQKLEKAAQKHADDMYSNNFFSHDGTDGSNVSSRVDQQGFVWMMVGENIAEGYINEKDVVAGWMSSPGHCKNIMNAEFTHMGVAVSSDGKYWVQVFATPMANE